ncbi:hypothetical protein Rin_00015010 [Candidatus Regiella insecticola 5.15]|uniref:Uncharacterized protein n=1 Tax=Candidatus Regiella insecticola 5.15 TaxID=1005043 RepID=G2H0C1_9ENTR|nr:hypothetical protein [Candidatus Regiella insecticola]EGY28565.1 hypothetical protein Rin_00015010 [Candidatus Regiella insecticola 5.15]
MLLDQESPFYDPSPIESDDPLPIREPKKINDPLLWVLKELMTTTRCKFAERYIREKLSSAHEHQKELLGLLTEPKQSSWCTIS